MPAQKRKRIRKKSFDPTLIVKSLVAVNAIVLHRVGIGERNASLYDANLFCFFCLASSPIPFCSSVKQAYLKLINKANRDFVELDFAKYWGN